jgi:glutamate racemase
MLKNKEKNIIGVFDSGLGGLNILKHFLKDLPQYDYLYLADTARVPYGNHSQETIYHYTLEAVDFLFKQGVRLIILACNTASSQALRRLQKEYLINNYPDRRILGVIIPLAEEVSRSKRIGVIGTRATINSQAYNLEIKKINNQAKIISNSTPLLVPLIEEWPVSKDIIHKILKKYLKPLKEKRVQELILGCTHYPFLLKDIRKIMGSHCQVFDPGHIISIKLKNYLQRHPEFQTENSKEGKLQFYISDESEKFTKLGSKFLGQTIKDYKIAKL